MGILLAMIGISALILIHELGHLLAAKWVGAPVKTFSLGFGKAIWSREWGGVTYQLGIIPAGGFVELAGEVAEDELEPPGFLKLSVSRRAFFYLGGVLANLLAAYLLFWGYAVVNDRTQTGTLPGVYVLQVNGAAAKVGIQPGDRLLTAGGLALPNTPSVASITLAKASRGVIKRGGECLLAVQGLRGGSPVQWEVHVDRVTGRLGLAIGLAPDEALHPEPLTFSSIWESAKVAGQRCFGIFQVMLGTFVGLVAGVEQATGSFGGPISMLRESAASMSSGPAFAVLTLAIISINLAVVNLLPVPVLDGGHLLFLILEGITSRRLSKRTRSKLIFAGGMILATCMILLTFGDLKKLFS